VDEITELALLDTRVKLGGYGNDWNQFARVKRLKQKADSSKSLVTTFPEAKDCSRETASQVGALLLTMMDGKVRSTSHDGRCYYSAQMQALSHFLMEYKSKMILHTLAGILKFIRQSVACDVCRHHHRFDKVITKPAW
jgi:hypothetical protein